MVYPTALTNQNEKGKRAPRRSATSTGMPKPSDPSGRLVITKLTGGPSGGDQLTHWCPRPTHDGQEWPCPDSGCGITFIYEQGDKAWRAKH